MKLYLFGLNRFAEQNIEPLIITSIIYNKLCMYRTIAQII